MTKFGPAAAPAIPPGALVGAGPDAAGAQTPAVTYVPLRAMEDVMAMRADQIFKHGHTAESDAAVPVRDFARQIHTRGIRIYETVQFNQGNAALRRRIIALAALCLAAIDRIDSEQEGNPLG